MTVVNSDRIEKEIMLRAPRPRVWRALTNSQAFGTWFGAKYEGPFIPGSECRGVIAPTRVDAAVAQMQQPYASMPIEITIDRIEPERLFSFRWHPYAIDQNVDYSAEPMTLVEFVLEEVPGGTLLKITESGFDRIAVERRATAFTANEGGWTMQMTLIEKYLAHGA
jgi:uncharacterized protein YndB with AHSA1/START domain